jgi:DNA-binding transcriptional LysR family regulator
MRAKNALKGLEAAQLHGLLPLDIMLCRIRCEPLPDGTMPTNEQLQAAVAAAPYVHPRLMVAQVTTQQRQRVLPPIDVAALPPHLRRPFEDILLYAELQRCERAAPGDANAHAAVGRLQDQHHPGKGQRGASERIGADAAEEESVERGLVQVPRYRVSSELASGALVEVLADFPPSPLPVHVLYSHTRQLSPRLRVFIDWMAEQFRERLSSAG